MANRFVSPQQQFINNAGQPYAGGFLNFYVSGTSTPTPTYQDEGLTVPNSNPVVLDSAGDAGNIFLDPGIVYKVVLTDSNLNPIWTFDPVIPTDSSSAAGFNAVVSCNAAGTNLITLTPITASQQPSAYSNFQIFGFVPAANTTAAVSLKVGTLPAESVYVAPGVQAGAGTFLANDGPYYVAYGSLVAGSGPGFLLLNSNIGGVQAFLPVTPPQGRLTPTSQTPVINADVIASTNIFYTPYTGLGAPIHNGTSIVSTLLSGELSLALTSAQVANNIYDVYLIYNGGTPVIGTGPSWLAGSGGSVTAGACARGTGAGGAALSRTQGIWTNAAAMTVTYNLGAGNLTASVAANQGILLGSIWIDSVAGQVTCHVSYGQSRKFGIWNANAANRAPIVLLAGDSTASWAYTTATIRASNGAAANNISTFTGLPEEPVNSSFTQKVQGVSVVGSSATLSWRTGIGLNSTTAFSGQTGYSAQPWIIDNSSTLTLTHGATTPANFTLAPTIGINVLQSLEITDTFVNNTVTYYGSNANMLLMASYRG